jgi:predicted nucleotidyltransferase
LRFLWRSRGQWSGREIARKVGLSAPSCHEALKKLDARGLVQFHRISNMHVYGLNGDSYLLKEAFIPLFAAEEDMPRQINALVRETLAAPPNDGIVSIAVFGSMARGTARLGSDLDVFIVLRRGEDVKVLEPRKEDLRKTLYQRFRLALSPYAQTLSELRLKHARKIPLIQEILKDGITIYGKEIKDLVP